MKPEEQDLTIKEVAAKCRVSTVTVLNWIKGRNDFGRTLKAHRIGWKWQIAPEDLEAFITR